MAPYNLEAYKKAGVEVDEFEAGRGQALVGIFKSRYLKRFESSIEAFRISIRRALEFLKTFESYILDGRLLKSSDFQRAMRYVSREDEEDDAIPTSMAEEMDASEEAKRSLEGMAAIDPSTCDLRRLHEAVQHDVDVLSEIWHRVKDISERNDAKLATLKKLLLTELRGKKVLVFTYYKDTARYLYRNLGHPENPKAIKFCKNLGGIRMRRMDSDADAKERTRMVQGFAPKANEKGDWVGTDKEIDILISTDVLSEGQNSQDCGYLVNYDLHWNPTRMVQRAGRIDRIGTEFETLLICNMFPDEGLERLLGLVESLNRKIADIDRAGFLDASVLGELVHPQNFNTLRRIRDEDGSVIDEEEQFTELASSEFLSQQLRIFLEKVIEDILRSFEQQQALQAAPRSVDAIQQTLATVVRGYMNHPDVDRRRAIETIRFLNRPMLTIQIRRLRDAYKNFQIKADPQSLLDEIEELHQQMGDGQPGSNEPGPKAQIVLRRDDLRLICMDFLTGV